VSDICQKKFESIERFGKKTTVVSHTCKTSSARQFPTDRDCSPLFQRTPRPHKRSDPPTGSGSSHKAHRLIRINCGDPELQLHQQQWSEGPTRPSRPVALQVHVLPNDSVDFQLDSTAPIPSIGPTRATTSSS